MRFVCHLLNRDNQDLIASFGDGVPTRRDPQIERDFLYNPEYPDEKHNQIYLDDMIAARVPVVSPYINESDFMPY